MVTIEFTRNGQSGTRKVHSFALTQTLASYRAAGYEITNDGSAPAVAEAASATDQTGRVGKGVAVHQVVEGHAKCGASYRRNSLGATTRRVNLTGEAVTCRAC